MQSSFIIMKEKAKTCTADSPSPQKHIRWIKLVLSQSENRSFDIGVKFPFKMDPGWSNISRSLLFDLSSWVRRLSGVLLCRRFVFWYVHVTRKFSCSPHLKKRVGVNTVRGGGRRGEGGQWTLHTKGYNELSLCVCALYSVCFSCSFLLRVIVGRHACANTHRFFFKRFSSCMERKKNNARELFQKVKHTTLIALVEF